MSVLENVMIGRHNSLKAGIFKAILRDASTREEEQRVIEESYLILKKLKLDMYVNETAKNLPMANSAAWKSHARLRPIRSCSY
jgi:branched-chain amino acid transport system ATP-binding protein